MELEKQVCSFELAKKLKELGVKQESYWAWIRKLPKEQVHWHDHNLLETHDEYFISANVKEWSWAVWQCCAFTVAELGEMLPKNILVRAIAEGEHGGRYYFYSTQEHCFYAMNNGQTRLYSEEADTEANARAKMLIYLIENEISSPKELH